METSARTGCYASIGESYSALDFNYVRRLLVVQNVTPLLSSHVVAGVAEPVIFYGPKCSFGPRMRTARMSIPRSTEVSEKAKSELFACRNIG